MQDVPYPFFLGPGNLPALVAGHDWQNSELGPCADWSPTLKTAVSICMAAHSPMALYWGPAYVLIYNEAWRPIAGHRHPDVIGKPAAQAWSEVWSDLKDLFDGVLLEGKSHLFEDAPFTLYRHGFAEDCFFSFNLSPARNEAGQIEGIINTVRETTFQVQQQLRGQILSALSEGLTGYETGKMTEVALEVLAGFSQTIPWACLYGEADGTYVCSQSGAAGLTEIPTAWVSLAQSQNKPEPLAIRLFWPGAPVEQVALVPIWTAKSLTHILLVGINPRTYYDASYQSFFCQIGQVLSNALTTAETLQMAQSRVKDLEELNRAKTEFFSNISHEIRTPMTAILGLSDLILDQTIEDPNRDLLLKINQSAKNLIRILNDVLDYAKLGSGRIQIQNEPFSLDTLLQQSADLFSADMNQKGMDFFIEVDPQLPLHVIGDSHRVSQVLNNLIGNAIKFTEKGHILVSLKKLDREGDDVWIQLTVQDTGIGIRAEHLKHLFKPFKQADGSITRLFGGTGLGLAICKQLVTLLGGTLTIESAFGVGTEMVFKLPFRIQHSDDVLSQQFSGLKALVVDDQSISLAIIGNYLKRWGIEHRLCASGIEALECVQQAEQDQQPFDLFLLDWKIPSINGLELAKRIQALSATRPHPFFLMVTAFGRERVMAEAALMQLQVDGVVTKPIIPSALVSCIQKKFQNPGTPNPTSRGASSIQELLAPLSGKKILLVEDNPINILVAKGYLLRGGVEIFVARDGIEAVEMVAQQPFDAVLMDLHMPRLGGLDATRKIRRSQPGPLPIIAMTASVMETDRQACLAAGMDGFICKPIEIEELAATLCRVLR